MCRTLLCHSTLDAYIQSCIHTSPYKALPDLIFLLLLLSFLVFGVFFGNNFPNEASHLAESALLLHNCVYLCMGCYCSYKVLSSQFPEEVITEETLNPNLVFLVFTLLESLQAPVALLFRIVEPKQQNKLGDQGG